MEDDDLWGNEEGEEQQQQENNENNGENNNGEVKQEGGAAAAGEDDDNIWGVDEDEVEAAVVSTANTNLEARKKSKIADDDDDDDENNNNNNNNNNNEGAPAGDDYFVVFGADEPERREAEEQEERDNEPQNVGDFSLSDLPRPADDEKLIYLRLPPSIAVEPSPFVREHFDDRHKHIGQRVIRWRREVGADGEEKIASTARVVTWSDGSKTLHIGGQAMLLRTEPMQKQKHHLFARHTRQMDLTQCHGMLDSKFVIAGLEVSGRGVAATKERQASRQTTILAPTAAEIQEAANAEEVMIRKKARDKATKKRVASRYGSRLTTEFVEGAGEEYDASRGGRPAKTARRNAVSSSEESEYSEESSGSESSEAEVVVNKARTNKRVMDSDSD